MVWELLLRGAGEISGVSSWSLDILFGEKLMEIFHAIARNYLADCW